MASNAKASNNTTIDPLYVSKDPSQSAFIPMGWEEFSNYSFDTLTATTAVERSFGGVSEFQIVPNTCTYIGKTLLEGVIDTGIRADTAIGAEYVDWLALFMIDKLTVEYATNEVQTIPGTAIKNLFFDQKMSSEEVEAYKASYLHFPSSVRQSNLSTNNLRIPFRIFLPLWYTHNTHFYMPQTQGTTLRIKIQWRPIQQCVNVPIGAVAWNVEPKIIEQRVRYQGIYTELDEATQLVQMTNTDTGILTLNKSVHEQIFIKESPLPAGITTFDIKLDFNSPCQTMFIGILRAEDYTTPFQMRPWNFRGWETDTIKLVSKEIIVSGGSLKTLQPAGELKFIMGTNRNNKRVIDGPNFFQDFSIHADAFTQNDGHLNFAGTSNPTLRLTLDVPAGEAPFKPLVIIQLASNNFVRNLLGTITKGAQ
jgi:hypothetical protein